MRCRIGSQCNDCNRGLALVLLLLCVTTRASISWLQSVEWHGRRAIQQRIAVIEARRNDAAPNRYRNLWKSEKPFLGYSRFGFTPNVSSRGSSSFAYLTLWLLRSFPVILPAYASVLLHYAEYSCYVAAVVHWFVGQLHYTQDVLRRPSHTQHTIWGTTIDVPRGHCVKKHYADSVLSIVGSV